MEKRIYITAEEREKCRKVADAFAELYEKQRSWCLMQTGMALSY
jgi:hypothetical protein